MPSNIRPKDFENYLPKETDTVAQGLVKFTQFAILFWRWFRSEFTSTGEWGYNIKSEMCASGCADPDAIPDNNDNNDDNNEDDDDEVEIPGPPIPPPETPDDNDVGCCKKIENYGTKNKEFSYFKGEGLHIIGDGDGGKESLVDLSCDSNNHKQVCVKTAWGNGISLETNENWSKAVRFWYEEGGYTTSPGRQQFIGDTPDGTIGKAVIKTGEWVNVEVVMYGTCEGFDVPHGVKPDAKISGYFQTNPAGESTGKKISFHIENGGVWCVRMLIRSWPRMKTFDSGFVDRSFKFKIDREVPAEFLDGKKSEYWKTGNKKYLCKVNGIRIVQLGMSDMHHASRHLKYPVQVGVEGGCHAWRVLYDERWQGEGAKPCYSPADNRPNARHLAYHWAEGGFWGDVGTIYPHSFVNDMEITHDLVD
jgi:hypothetical protein